LALASSAAVAQESLLFTRNARSLHGVYSPLLVKGLAHACLALPPLADSPACNPALNDLESEPRLSILGNLSNGYVNLSSFYALSNGQLEADLSKRIFDENNPLLQVEANGALVFFSKALAIRYIPVDLNAYLVARNEANPQVEIGYVQSHVGEIQGGLRITRDLRAGLRLQGGQRQALFTRFQLLTPVIPTTTTSWFVNVEPGLAYEFARVAWSPRVGFMLANLKYENIKQPRIGAPIDPQIGVSVSPPLPWGELSIEVALRRLSEEADFWRRPRLGALYRFGALSVSAGVDRDGLSLGFLSRFGNLNTGILFASTRSVFESTDFFTQTLYLEAGWTF